MWKAIFIRQSGIDCDYVLLTTLTPLPLVPGQKSELPFIKHPSCANCTDHTKDELSRCGNPGQRIQLKASQLASEGTKCKPQNSLMTEPTLTALPCSELLKPWSCKYSTRRQDSHLEVFKKHAFGPRM